MQLKAILNRVQKDRCFVYEGVRLLDDCIEVDIRARKNSKAICSVCQTAAPGYDTLPRRRFEFVPLWAVKVFFVYARRWIARPVGDDNVTTSRFFSNEEAKRGHDRRIYYCCRSVRLPKRSSDDKVGGLGVGRLGRSRASTTVRATDGSRNALVF